MGLTAVEVRKKVRNASEMDGAIVEKIDSKYLKALSFSPMK